jgi:hypothetical protein
MDGEKRIELLGLYNWTHEEARALHPLSEEVTGWRKSTRISPRTPPSATPGYRRGCRRALHESHLRTNQRWP